MPKKNKKHLYIITGYSGSGKTEALRFIQERNFYCVDNLPARLLTSFVQLLFLSKGITKVAVVIDARGKDFMKDLQEDLEIVQNKFETKIIFFECSLQTIIRRYKESRLNHPLALKGSISSGYNKERELLTYLRQEASHVINTSDKNIHELRAELYKVMPLVFKEKYELHIMSFGFKYGIPEETDIVIDVRCLVNPYFEPKLKKLTGKDPRIKKYIFNDKKSTVFVKKTFDYLDYLIKSHHKATKNNITIAFGCTGGKHRSVAVAEKMKKLLKPKYKTATIFHRDILKK